MNKFIKINFELKNNDYKLRVIPMIKANYFQAPNDLFLMLRGKAILFHNFEKFWQFSENFIDEQLDVIFVCKRVTLSH